MIELSRVSKYFGQRLALDALTLTVPEGVVFGLLGHNGAGKSTAIGILLGQVWPSDGQARVCGFDVTRNRSRALAPVGAIFETPAFYDYLSGWRNLEILAGYTAPVSARRITEVLDWVGLTGRERSAVRTYSHGMRSRLALAQALLPNPELLILDEPGDGLDPEGIHEMRQTILRLNRELGLTILFSSHQLNEVEQVCSHIAVLHSGRKVFDGEVRETSDERNFARLRVGDFASATKELLKSGLITSANGEVIELAPSVEIPALVRRVVELGIPVYEVGPVRQTLEDFYLRLSEQERQKQK
ncbi:MAG: ABC transporter ATP-binding protein [Verrucomicrobia subdivision 3 bacterium]|nr:ABC transporter ATP-binding protein [Limisphaerales bacterium]